MVKKIKIELPEKKDFDKALVKRLKIFLDTETKAKIYLYLRKKGKAISEEIAKGTDLYPSSVREALIEMTEKGILKREKKEREGTGKKPYLYDAISPLELTNRVISKIEKNLNDLLSLDRVIKDKKEISHEKFPFKITIERVKKSG